METEPIIIERVYDSSTKEIWQALTEIEKINKWYFHLEKFEPVVGFKFKFPGKGKTGDEYTHRCIVTTVEPERKLSYTWVYDGYKGESNITFELHPERYQTRLKIIHRGVESFPKGHLDLNRENFINGWKYFSENLNTYLNQS